MYEETYFFFLTISILANDLNNIVCRANTKSSKEIKIENYPQSMDELRPFGPSSNINLCHRILGIRGDYVFTITSQNIVINLPYSHSWTS